jgi:large subunit ribosomal protein L17
MRHRISKKSFNRDTKSRASLLRGVTVAVLEHGEIVTTKAKGQAARAWIEAAITMAKRGDVPARRQLHRMFGRRDVVNNLCERVAPAVAGRSSGFVRLVLVGRRRGDNTALYRLSLVETLSESKKQQKLAARADQKAERQKTKTENKAHKGDTESQQAIKTEQVKAEKSSRLTRILGGRRATSRTSVAGGGRGK